MSPFSSPPPPPARALLSSSLHLLPFSPGQVGNLGQANYAASKAGVEALTKTAAKELAR